MNISEALDVGCIELISADILQHALYKIPRGTYHHVMDEKMWSMSHRVTNLLRFSVHSFLRETYLPS